MIKPRNYKIKKRAGFSEAATTGRRNKTVKTAESGVRAWFFVLCAAILALAAGCSATLIRVSDKKEIGMPQIVESARNARIVLIGEVHTETVDHENQLTVIKAMKAAGINFAIGMEMFQAKDQPKLDEWVAGRMSEDDFIKVYYMNWHVPWREYRPILVYARDNSIPVIGLNVSQSVMHQIFSKGYESLTPKELAEVPGIKCVVDKTYEKFIRQAMEEHSLKGVSFTKFCEAQLVWDTVMARNSVKYLDAHPGTKLVVLAGSGHSWKRGIPEQVKKISSYPCLVILPAIPGKLDVRTATTEDADYIIVDPLWSR